MAQQETIFKKGKALAAGLFGAAVTLITLGAGCASQQASEQPPVQVQTPVSSSEPPTPKPGASSYKDGAFTAQGQYFTHEGPENVSVTLTLKNGVITDSKFQGSPNAMMSGYYMQMFADNYKPMVIGQSIDSVNLDRVSGSSLTPMGFNDAVSKIKAQAKA